MKAALALAFLILDSQDTLLCSGAWVTCVLQSAQPTNQILLLEHASPVIA